MFVYFVNFEGTEVDLANKDECEDVVRILINSIDNLCDLIK